MADPAAADVQLPAPMSQWHAMLRLRYRRENARTFLSERAHVGPLVVQKSLYPEGNAVCQSVIVHPPGGIAGGDSLSIDIGVDEGAHAQFTTPGAAKWYRSSAMTARQSVSLDVADDAVLEWLPQEAIVFSGAMAEMETSIRLAPSAVYIGWDIVCLGRTASGERLDAGEVRQRLSVRRAGALLFAERLVLTGGGAELGSPVVLNDATVFGTLLAIAPHMTDAMQTACREVNACDGDGYVTRLPALMVARYRGASSQSARAYFATLWARLRPMLIGRDPLVPRLWST
jgi:urease accessory protein